MKDIKLGDKILCKKSNKGHDNDVGVEENVWYEIVDISKIPADLTAYTYNNFGLVRYVQVNDGGVFNISFCLNINNYGKDDYIWDYFYSQKELRKLKLDEISKI